MRRYFGSPQQRSSDGTYCGRKHVVHREGHCTLDYTALFANGFTQSKYLVKNPLMTKGFSHVSVFSELPGSTNYAELTSSGALNNRYLYLHSSRGWKSKIEVSPSLVSSESPSHDVPVTTFSCALPQFVSETLRLIRPQSRGVTACQYAPVLPYLLPDRPSLQTQSHSRVLRVRTSTYEFGQVIQFIP